MNKTSATKGAKMTRPIHITPLHVERGMQMKRLVEIDIVRKGFSLEQSIDSLASFLEIDPEAVRLGIAIANEWG